MKLTCPESQKRVSLKCGSIASGSALPGGLDESSAGAGGVCASACGASWARNPSAPIQKPPSTPQTANTNWNVKPAILSIPPLFSLNPQPPSTHHHLHPLYQH